MVEKTENLLDQQGKNDASAMPPIYFRARVTFTFDRLKHKPDRFIPYPCGRLVPIGIKIASHIVFIW